MRRENFVFERRKKRKRDRGAVGNELLIVGKHPFQVYNPFRQPFLLPPPFVKHFNYAEKVEERGGRECAKTTSRPVNVSGVHKYSYRGGGREGDPIRELIRCISYETRKPIYNFIPPFVFVIDSCWNAITNSLNRNYISSRLIATFAVVN